MGYGRSVKLAAALLVGAMGVLWSVTAARAENVDANIGGIAVFTGADGKAFRVNSEKNLNLERFETWEGDIQVDWTPGVKTSQGGKVAVGSVNSVGNTAYYHAWGHYAGGQGGNGTGPSPTWDADYKKGNGNLIVHINDISTTNDDYVATHGDAVARIYLTIDPDYATQYATRVYDYYNRIKYYIADSPYGNDYGLYNIANLGWDGSCWWDYRCAYMSRQNNGETEIRAEYPSYGAVAMEGHRTAKCIETELVPGVDLNGTLSGRGYLRYSIPINASYPVALNGTGKNGEVKAALKVIGPAGDYSFKISSTSANGGTISGGGQVAVSLAGTGNNLEGYTNAVVLTGTKECNDGETGPIVKATTIGTNDPVTVADQQVVTYKIVGELTDAPVTQFAGFPEHTFDTNAATIYQAAPGETIGGTHQVTATTLFAERARNYWTTSPLSSAGTISVVAYTGEGNSGPERATAGTEVKQLMQLKFVTVPAQMIDGMDIDINFDLQREVRFDVSCDANSLQGTVTGFSVGCCSIDVAPGSGIMASASGNACWEIKDPSGAVLVAKGVADSLAQASCSGLATDQDDYKCYLGVKTASLIASTKVQSEEFSVVFWMGVGAVRGNVGTILKSTAMAGGEAKRPSVTITSATLKSLP